MNAMMLVKHACLTVTTVGTMGYCMHSVVLMPPVMLSQ